MARNLIKILSAHYDCEIVSDFRSLSHNGADELTIRDQALLIGARLQKNGDYDLWFTYHPYHKSPDWLGLEYSKARSIPYILFEASIAEKQKNGPWSLGHAQTLECVKHADLILTPAPHDKEGLMPYLKYESGLHYLPPFLDPPYPLNSSPPALKQTLAEQYGIDPHKDWLLSVGMMREGAKFDSYRYLSDLYNRPFFKKTEMIFIGDGPKKTELQKIYADKGICVHWIGELDKKVLCDFYQASSLLIWPAVKEAYGMALLEAQYYKLPVIIGLTGSIDQMLDNQKTGFLCNPADPDSFERAIFSLLTNPKKLEEMKNQAHTYILDRHNIERAGKTIHHLINGL